MANQLEGLAEHFEKMEVALKESEAGEKFSEDDIQGMRSCIQCVVVVIQVYFKR